MQFAKLRRIHCPRRFRHNASRSLRFRECYDITDGAGTAHEHNQSIQTEGETTMGWRAVFERIQEEAELLTGFLGVQFML